MKLPQLVPDVHRAWRWHSMHLSGTGAVLSAFVAGATHAAAVAPLFGVFPLWAAFAVLTAVFVGSMIARLIKQRESKHDNEGPEK